MKVIIIEDELKATKYLIKLLHKLDPLIEVVKTLDSVKSSVRYLKKHNSFELIFSDVQLGDGISFEIFDEVDVSVPVIFTTAFDQYAIKAFKLNSIDYVLKPIKEEDLEFSIEKYKKGKIGSQNVLEKVTSLLKTSESDSNDLTVHTLLIQSRSGLVPVKTREFSFFYVENTTVIGIITSKNRFIVDKTIGELEKELDPILFFRVNRQMLVHRDAIDRVYHYYHGKMRISVTPTFDDDIIISKAKVKNFKNWLTAH